jgi:hypothetical protein
MIRDLKKINWIAKGYYAANMCGMCVSLFLYENHNMEANRRVRDATVRALASQLTGTYRVRFLLRS